MMIFRSVLKIVLETAIPAHQLRRKKTTNLRSYSVLAVLYLFRHKPNPEH